MKRLCVLICSSLVLVTSGCSGCFDRFADDGMATFEDIEPLELTAECQAVNLARDSSRPFRRVDVDLHILIPDGDHLVQFRDHLVMVIEYAQGEQALLPQLVFYDEDEDRHYFFAPPHIDGASGGTLTLQFTDGEIACEPVEFQIEESPPSPGAFEQTIENAAAVSRDLLDFYGFDADELLDTPEDDIPFLLKPLVNHVWLTDHPNNPDSLMEALRNRTDPFDIDDEAFAEAEALLGEMGYIDGLIGSQDRLVSLRAEDPDFELVFRQTLPISDGTLGTVQQPLCSSLAARKEIEIHGLRPLSTAMTSAYIGEGYLRDYEVISAWVTLLSAIGGSIAGLVVGTVIRREFYLRKAHTHLMPSRLYDPRMTLSPQHFSEDFLDPGLWDDYSISARSLGWNATNDVVYELLRGLSFFYPSLFVILETMDFLDAIDTLQNLVDVNFLRNNVIFESISSLLENTEACLLETGPWENIPAHSTEYPLFFDIEYRGALDPSQAVNASCPDQIPTGQNPREFVPYRTGMGQVAVNLRGESFPPEENRAHSRLQHDLETRMITFLPSRQYRTVDPGEEVELEAQLRWALDPDVEWSVFQGEAEILEHHVEEDIPGMIYDVSARVRVSSSVSDFPVVIYVESLSDRGLRADTCSPPPRNTFFFLRAEEELSIAPQAMCIPEGGTLQFEIIELSSSEEDPTIHWSASDGSISSSGYFTPPAGRGEYTIKAALNEDTYDEAKVRVGACECFYSLTLTGGGEAHVGEFANVQAEFIPNEVFMLSFGSAADGTDVQFIVPDPLMREGHPFVAPVGGTVALENVGLLAPPQMTLWYWPEDEEVGWTRLDVEWWADNDYIQGRIIGVTNAGTAMAVVDGQQVMLPFHLAPTTLEIEFMAPLYNLLRNPAGRFLHGCPSATPDLPNLEGGGL